MLHLLMTISILLGQNEPGLIWLWVMLILRLWVMLLPKLEVSVWLTLEVEARVMVGRVFGLGVIWLLAIVFNQLYVVVATRQGLIIDGLRIVGLRGITWSSSGLVMGPKPWLSRLLSPGGGLIVARHVNSPWVVLMSSCLGLVFNATTTSMRMSRLIMTRHVNSPWAVLRSISA